MLRELGWPVYLCSELGMTEGNAFFFKYLFISNPKFSSFSEKFFIWIEDFQKFPLTIETNQEFNESKKRLQVIQ